MCRKLTEFFQQPRYRINKFLLCCNGQWPYQDKRQKNFLLAVTLLFPLTVMPSQIRSVFIHRGNWSKIIPAMGPILVHMCCIIKILNSIYYADKMRQLLERVYDDWHTPMGPEENIFAQFADDGRLYTVTYTVWLSTSTITFLILSSVPHILAVKGWANMSSPTKFVIPIYYTANDEEYYSFLQTYVSTGIVVVLLISIAVDCMFVVFVQHACGIFAAVGYQLEHVIDSDNLDIDLHPCRIADKTFCIVIDCIKRHKAAIEFADLLDSAYSRSFLLLLGLNMLSMSFTGLQVLWGASPDSLDEAIRQAVFGGSQLLHLFFENLFSQRLTDHSLDVFHAITKTKWYLLSKRTRVLLQFMLMRSMIPWELRAGSMYTMSMANFSSVVRTSLSYLTILGSME